jgi:hypothetical protein
VISTKRWGILALAGALAVAGCAGLVGTLRPVIPVGEIPSGEYEVRALRALAPTKQPDGEVVAAVLYTKPSGPRVEVWETSYPTGSRGWLWEQSLGKGSGREHLPLVKSPAHYETVTLPGRDGRPIGYALLHRTGVHASLQDWNGKTVLFLSAVEFIDPDYIRSGDGRDGGKN